MSTTAIRGISLSDVIRSQGTLRIKAIKALDHTAGGLAARCFPRRHRGPESLPREGLRLLVIRPGGIGDAVFLLPVLRELKRSGALIDVLCERRNAQAFRSQPELCASVFCYDVWPEFREALGRTYDVVVDTEQWHHLSAVVARLISSRLTVGFATRPSRARLFDVPAAYSLDEYELDNFVRLFGFAGVRPSLELKGSWQVAPQDAAWAGQAAQGPYVALAFAGSIPAKRFTTEQAVAHCRQALDRGRGVVLLGGSDVTAFARDVAARVNDRRVVDLTGRSTLAQSAAVIAAAERFIGHDSGLLHIAAALGVPATAVFGPGDPKKWGPRGAQDEIVHAGLPCSPCMRFGYTLETCHHRFECLRTGRDRDAG